LLDTHHDRRWQRFPRSLKGGVPDSPRFHIATIVFLDFHSLVFCMLDVRFFCSFFYLTTHSFIDYVIHSFSSQQLPYFLIIAASILLLISIIGTGYNEGYGIAVAVVAGVIALLALVASYKVEAKFATVSIYIAYLLLIWNGVAAVILTFNGPFIATTNGYFASWALVVFATMATGLSYGTLSEKVKNSGVLTGLVMASTVLVISLLFIGFGNWRHIYGVIIAILTICLCAIFIYLDYIESEAGALMRSPFLRFFACLWISVVVLLTMARGAFQVTGNGYFAAWIGCILCVYAAIYK